MDVHWAGRKKMIDKSGLLAYARPSATPVIGRVSSRAHILKTRKSENAAAAWRRRRVPRVKREQGRGRGGFACACLSRGKGRFGRVVPAWPPVVFWFCVAGDKMAFCHGWRGAPPIDPGRKLERPRISPTSELQRKRAAR